MFDLKVINSILNQLEEERGIPRERIIEAIEWALATAYKKEYGKRGQIIRSHFDPNTGTAELEQIKIVVDKDKVVFEEDLPDKEAKKEALEEGKIVFNPEQHIFLEDARKIKKDAEVDEELSFPLESGKEYGRIASQTAKQVIMQKIREAEKASVLSEFGEREGEIVSGTVQRIERGNIFVDMERATGILPYEEQMPGERFRQGERIRAYLYHVEESSRGVFLRLSRSHPRFLEKLFEAETPEIANGVIEIRSVAREPGSRSKIATLSHDDSIDPVGSLVGQRGVRVSTVMSELGGEKIDIIEWSEDPEQFVADALSPAEVMGVEIDKENKEAHVEVQEDQQSLAIGKGGQNVRLAARLTGWKIDIKSTKGESVAHADEKGDVEIQEEKTSLPEEIIDDKQEEEKDEKKTEEQEEVTNGSEDESTKQQEEAENDSPEEVAEEENTKEQ
ncbi:MAG: transcription termination factor NusA [Candidatus Paceibacterota bacterium]